MPVIGRRDLVSGRRDLVLGGIGFGIGIGMVVLLGRLFGLADGLGRRCTDVARPGSFATTRRAGAPTRARVTDEERHNPNCRVSQ